MAFDFKGMEMTCKRLIDENGASVKLVKTTHKPASPNQRWRGPNQASKTELSSSVEKSGKGVIYNADEKSADGSIILRGDLVLMVCAKDFDYRGNWDTAYMGKKSYAIKEVRTIASKTPEEPIAYEFVIGR